MDQEKQIAQALMEDNLSWPEWLDGVAIAKQVRELGIPSTQLLESIEAATELRDPNFRAAAFDLLELRKRTGKNSKEVETYIGELSSRSLTLEGGNTAKEKLKVSLEQDIKQYQQKCRDEKKKLESEQVKNRRILEEDMGRLEQQLKQNNQTRESINKAVTLRDRLEGIGLALPCFISIVEEASQNKGIDLPLGKEISRHIIEYESFLEARRRVKGELKSIKANIAELSQIESEEGKTLTSLEGQIARKKGGFDKLMEEIKLGEDVSKSQSEQIKANRWQYEFFQLFISILCTSPSAPESAAALGAVGTRGSPLSMLGLKIQELSKKGWSFSEGTPEKTLEKCRAAFIVSVMGPYLHSIHCEHCGASFIVNKRYDFDDHRCTSYYCPVCHVSVFTRPDDTFLNLMVSPELGKKLQDTRNFLDMVEKTDMAALEKGLKLLDLLPSEIYKALSEGRSIEVKVADGTN